MRGTKTGFVAEKSKKALAGLRQKRVSRVQPGPQTTPRADLPVLEVPRDVLIPEPIRLVGRFEG